MNTTQRTAELYRDQQDFIAGRGEYSPENMAKKAVTFRQMMAEKKAKLDADYAAAMARELTDEEKARGAELLKILGL